MQLQQHLSVAKYCFASPFVHGSEQTEMGGVEVFEGKDISVAVLNGRERESMIDEFSEGPAES